MLTKYKDVDIVESQHNSQHKYQHASLFLFALTAFDLSYVFIGNCQDPSVA